MAISEQSFLKRMWQEWIRFGHWLGNIMSWVWMPLFYYIMVLPFAVGVRLFSDPLQRKKGNAHTYWVPKHLPKLDMRWARSQGSVVEEGQQ